MQHNGNVLGKLLLWLNPTKSQNLDIEHARLSLTTAVHRDSERHLAGDLLTSFACSLSCSFALQGICLLLATATPTTPTTTLTMTTSPTSILRLKPNLKLLAPVITNQSASTEMVGPACSYRRGGTEYSTTLTCKYYLQAPPLHNCQ